MAPGRADREPDAVACDLRSFQHVSNDDLLERSLLPGGDSHEAVANRIVESHRGHHSEPAAARFDVIAIEDAAKKILLAARVEIVDTGGQRCLNHGIATEQRGCAVHDNRAAFQCRCEGGRVPGAGNPYRRLTSAIALSGKPHRITSDEHQVDGVSAELLRNEASDESRGTVHGDWHQHCYTAATDLTDRQDTTPDAAPSVSVIVPAHNSALTLDRCLAAVCGQLRHGDELIVVDDGSTDDTPAVIARFPVRRLAHDRDRGAAAARNAGARLATGEVLFFVDADVILHEGALERGRKWLADPSVDAVIGSYDDEPAARSVVSLFKNLAHHYFHQRAGGRVDTFWGACGLVRRTRFFEIGGFDENRFRRPSIEDVELGWRMADAGAHMRLDPGLQVTHLKRWTFGTLLSTDLRQRAIPWMRLSLARRGLNRELNVTADQRVAAALAVLLSGALISAPVWTPARIGLPVLLAAAVAVNRRLYALFWRKGGFKLAIAGFLLQQVYYLYSLGGAIAGLVAHVI
jgi:hypothetical protein